MTNDTDTKTYSYEILPWTTAHLKCKCGHKWDDHDGLGCTHCNCLA